MKMQELIGEFRDETPKLAKAMEKSRDACRKMVTLFHDYNECVSQEAKDVLMGAVQAAMAEFSSAYCDVDSGVRRLTQLNDGYTRVLGPRKPKAEDPGQTKMDFGGTGND